MDDVVNRFARELADSIAAAVSESAEVEACRERARAAGYEMFATFDAADPAAHHEHRAATIVPGQALFMLNSDFAVKQAQALANRITPVREKLDDKPKLNNSDIPQRLDELYWLALGRPSTDEELAAAKKLLSRYRSEPLAGWTSVARAVLASAEFRSTD